MVVRRFAARSVLSDAQIDWIDTELARDARPTAFTQQKETIKAKLKQDRERSLEEVAGCREMLAVIYDQPRELFPLTQSSLRGLHHELLKYYSPANFHLGRYKVVPNSVIERNPRTGEERTILKTSDPGPLTELAMDELLNWYNAILPSTPWTLAVASEFVFRFLACHPFQDGNGRIGRSLFLALPPAEPGSSSERAGSVPRGGLRHRAKAAGILRCACANRYRI